MDGLGSALNERRPEHDQQTEGCAEAHSGSDQLDNVNRLKSLEAGFAGDVLQVDESDERN